MAEQVLSVEQIKTVLLEYHRKKGYKIFKSFPLVSDDPTVMFTNSTITPFKKWFTDSSIKPQNYALVQNCLRVGGADELNLVGFNPYYHTFFEMFGSGTFAVSHEEAIYYLLEIVDYLNFEKSRVYFTIPEEEEREFYKALRGNGIEQSHIFTLGDNDLFWQEWKFGKLGPVGRGLTVIYSQTDIVRSVREMTEKPEQFVELLNLIHIYGQETEDGAIISVAQPGFDLGVGIERLAAALQGCNNYQIDSIGPLAEIVHGFLVNQGMGFDESIIRVCTDHLRAICILISEGLSPSNKEHGYVLRKLIRKFLEFVWIALGRIIQVETVVESFAERFNHCGIQAKVSPLIVTTSVIEESLAFRRAISRGRNIVRRRSDIPSKILRDTYGISRELIYLLEKEETHENDKC